MATPFCDSSYGQGPLIGFKSSAPHRNTTLIPLVVLTHRLTAGRVAWNTKRSAFIPPADNGINLAVVSGVRFECSLVRARSLYLSPSVLLTSARLSESVEPSAFSLSILTLHCEHANDASARSSRRRRPVETSQPEDRAPRPRYTDRERAPETYVPAQRCLLRDLML